jgi:oligoendopeptidase F
MKLTKKQLEWNYDPLLQNGKEDFVALREEIRKMTNEFVAKYRTDKEFLTDPQALKDALDSYELYCRTYANGGNEKYYYEQRDAIDQTDLIIKGKEKRADDFAVKNDNELAFFELELAKIPLEKQHEFTTSPLLTQYKHYLERLFAEAKFMRGEKEERIMSLQEDTSYGDWIDMTERFLGKEERNVLTTSGKRKKMAFTQIQNTLDDKDKLVRDDAAKKLDEILAKHVDTAEAEMNAILQYKKVTDEIRGFSYPQESRMIDDDMSFEDVTNMVESVTTHFDISARYYELKARLFKEKQLAYPERDIEYGEERKTYTTDEAFSLVHEALTKLHPQFGEIMDKFIREGSYDVYPKKGKYSGSFCTEGLVSQPTYILLNFTGRLDDVFAIAHETGHGINFELMREHQNALTVGTSLGTAEVASLFMEDFVLQKLLDGANDSLRLTLQMQKLNEDVAAIFRQIALYNFESEIHPLFASKGFITKEEFGELFKKHMKAYLGEYVDMTPGTQNWWVPWSHIRDYFYVYSYANGLLIAKALQSRVKQDPSFATNIIEFLSTGQSLSPDETFKKMGIDISEKQFWESGIAEVENLLTDTWKLAEKLSKI